MQESMLFYAQTRITAKQASLDDKRLTHDVLFNQSNIDIIGEIQVPEFIQAWQQILNDNGAFRTGFVWEGLKQAQQFVRKEIELPFTFTDLSGREEQAKASALDEIICKDLERGFDLSKAPLMRIHLIQLSTLNFRLVWSSHHLIIDRWCIPLVFETFVQYYDALAQQKSLPLKLTPPFKRYIAWRHKRASDKSLQYWQANLAGFSKSSRLCERQTSASLTKVEHFIDAKLMSQVKQFCRSNKVTLPSLFQSAWALMLNQLLGLQDIAYGLVVSGRPAKVKDVENIIGSFVNNIPVRLSLPKGENALQWLKQVQSDGFQRIEHEHESIIELHRFTRLQIDEPLFDHVLVWQNEAPLSNSQFFKLSPISGELHTAYPLTISIEEKEQGLQVTTITQDGWYFVHKDEFINVLESMLQQLSQLGTEQKLQDLQGLKLSDDFIKHTLTKNVVGASTKVPSGKLLDKVITGRTSLTTEVVEEFLIQEWKSVLELDDISIDDDFFSLGGTSLQAAQLVARLEQAEQKHIPIIQLFAGRTIRSMTEVYVSSDWSIKPQWTTPVNTRGQGSPIFYIASPEVNTIGYAHLVRELGHEISGYIVQPPPTSEHVRQVRTHQMPALSLEFIKEIKHIQPHGPYRIIGMCSGAHIGAEIVRQMEKQSMEVSFFGVVNTWSLYSISKLYYAEKAITFYRKVRYYVRRVKSLKWDEIKHRFLPALKNRILRNEPDAPLETETTIDPQYAAPVRQYDETVNPLKEEKWASERPRNITKIKSPVTIFRIKDKPYWRISSYAQGWEHLTEETKVVPLKEQVHERILREPYVGHFANQLREELLNVKEHDEKDS